MGQMNKFVCDKCGKILQWDDDDFIKAEQIINQCHNVNLGRMGYGSLLDGSVVNFNICDDCLYEFIQSFVNRDKIIYSGANLGRDPYADYC